MKAHLTKVSLALLSAAFLLGCQEQGPTEPETQLTILAMVTTSGSLTYTVTHSGAVTTDPLEIDGRKGVGKKSQQVDVGGHGNTDAIVFSDDFANQLGDFAEACFPSATAATDDPRDPHEFSGALRRDKKNPLKVTAQYFFRAFGTDGTTEFKYQILLTGTIPAADVTFPPDPGETVVVTWGAADMNVEGFGKGKKGGNAGSACVGDNVTIDGGVTIVGDPI